MRFLSYSVILLLQLCVLMSTANAAPRFEDRKPINSGMWFDPSRSGEGFELRAVRDEVFIVWFAYDEQRKPIWYTAQGLLKTDAEMRYPLQKYRFQNGQAIAAPAGELVFKSVSSTRISVAFTLGASTGTRMLIQLEPSANAAEIVHSGQWYQPTKSGYGLGLSESENAGIAVLYVYDKNGAPIWLFGARNSVKTTDYSLLHYTGSCPSCTYAAPVTRAAGLLKIDFPAADSIVVSVQSPEVGNDFQLTRVPLSRLTPDASELAANRSLVAAPDANSLKRELLEASKTVFPVNISDNAGVGFSPAPVCWHTTTVPFLTPNLVAQNLDEAISIRADGDFVYTLSPLQSEVRVLQYQAGQLKVTREIKLRSPPALPEVNGQALATPTITSALNGFMLYGDEVIVTRGTTAPRYFTGAASFLPPPSTFANGRVLVEFVKKNGAAPSRSLEIEGVLLASRRIENRLYILSRSSIDPAASIVGGTAQSRALQVQAMPVENFLPSIWINGSRRAALTAPNVYSPPVGVPKGNQYIMLTQIDLDRTLEAAGTIKSSAVLGQISSYYFSDKALTIATNRFFLGADAFQDFQTLQRPFSTELHRFSLNASGSEYIGTGSVDGVLDLNADLAGQRFGESQDELRVVTTFNRQANAASRNRLSILAPSTVSPYLLKTVSTLPNASQPATLGKPGESLFGTRFVGDKLYGVSLRQSDPVYVVDLKDSSKPVIASEIPLPGFSSYMYPVGRNFVLSVANDQLQNEVGGGEGALTLSLFDLSVASRPALVSSVAVGTAGSSTALFNSHLALSAVSISSERTHVSIPATIFSSVGSEDYSGLVQLDINHGSAPSMSLKEPLRASIPTPAQNLTVAIRATNAAARGLYLRDLRIYVENGRVWYQRGAQVFGPL